MGLAIIFALVRYLPAMEHLRRLKTKTFLELYSLEEHS